MPRLTPKEAQGLMNAYAKVYAPKEEEASTDVESSKEESAEVKSEKSEE